MISDPLDRWKSRIGESSQRTYLPWFESFKQFSGKTPVQLVELSPQEASDLAAEFHNSLKNQNYSSKSCSTAYGAIRSFFTYNGVHLEKMSKKFSGKTQYEGSRELTQLEVYRLVEAITDYRDKGAVGVCFQGGQRDGVVANLKIKNIVTKNWESASVVVFNVPEFLPNEHGKNVNKREVKYRFGVLNDVARFVKLHLDERECAGEKIEYDSWLFRSRMVAKAKKSNYSDSCVRPITPDYINHVVSDAATKIGIQEWIKTGRGRLKAVVHAHSSREYFKTQTRMAGVDPDLRNFMVGHEMPYGGAYDKFAESEIVDAMEKSRSRLSLTPEPMDELERRKQNTFDSAKLWMKPEVYEQFEKLALQCKSSEEFNEVIEKFRNGREQLEKR